MKFHDSTAFDARAVKASFDRVRDKANGLRRWSLFNNIAEIVPEADLRATFRLSELLGAFFGNVAHPASAIISPVALQRYGKDVRTRPAGTGPFRFVEWQLGERVVVERNPDYWDTSLPHVQRMTFKPVPEVGTRVAMVLAGEAQFVYPPLQKSEISASGSAGSRRWASSSASPRASIRSRRWAR